MAGKLVRPYFMSKCWDTFTACVKSQSFTTRCIQNAFGRHCNHTRCITSQMHTVHASRATCRKLHSKLTRKHPWDTCTAMRTNYFFCTGPVCTDSVEGIDGTVGSNKQWTVQEAITYWSKKFIAGNIPEGEISAKYIIAHAIGLKQLGDLTYNVIQRHLLHREQSSINNLCEKRLTRMPVQYIIGEWDFRNLTLLMRPPVFVPCPETEELVELVLDHYSPSDSLHFLEIGCGSGAICISLLLELPKAYMTVVEKSREACELTKENATRLGLIDRLTIHQTVWGKELPRCLHGNKFDAIVSNPPYIAQGDLKSVGREVIRHMDNGAIDGGIDGLYHIKNICQQARHILNNNGYIWLETDTYHSDMIDSWLQDQPSTRLTLIEVYTDFASKPRFCQLQMKEVPG